MDRRKFLSLSALIASLGALGAVPIIKSCQYDAAKQNTPNRIQTYDNSSNLVSDEAIEQMTQGVGKVINKVTYQKHRRVGNKMERDGEHIAGGMGCGLLLYKGDKAAYILSCYHIINVEPQIIGVDRTGLFMADNPVSELGLVYKDNEDFFGTEWINLMPVAIDKDADLSILRADKDLKNIDALEQFNEFAEDRKVAQGDFVYTVGYPHGMANYLTTGVVSSKGGVAVFDDTFYWISSTLNPGNSGGPSFVLDKGKPKILGVNVAGYGPSMFCCVKNNEVKKLLKSKRLEKLIG